MKIAITGTSGTGKSTLTHALAQQLGLIAIDEHYEPLFDTKVKSDFPPRLSRILENKHQLEVSANNFVVDRLPLDLIHIWLNQSGHKINPALTRAFLERCIRLTSGYDFVVVTPWNSIPLLPTGNLLPRNMDILEQLRNHASLVGHVHMWVEKTRIIEIPQSMTRLDDRINFIIAQIKKRRPGLLPSDLIS